MIPELLAHGAEAYGFRAAVWNCARVAQVISEEFGVAYSTSHVSRLLRLLEWSPQQPISRAIQRDEAAISGWRNERWPALYAQAKRERRIVVFVDEAGFYLLPGRVTTYSPRGETPVLTECVTHDHLSVMGGLTPVGKVYVLVRQQALNGLHSIEFLRHLLCVVGAKVLLIWDGSPIHRRQQVQQFVEQEAGKVILQEFLPGYTPDLNPWDAGAWQHLKHVEMGNLSCMDLEELHLELHLAIGRLRHKPHLIRQFYKVPGLAL